MTRSPGYSMQNELRRDCWIVSVIERWIEHAGIRVNVFFADVLAAHVREQKVLLMPSKDVTEPSRWNRRVGQQRLTLRTVRRQKACRRLRLAKRSAHWFVKSVTIVAQDRHPIVGEHLVRDCCHDWWRPLQRAPPP